jgi:hypothetical protein
MHLTFCYQGEPQYFRFSIESGLLTSALSGILIAITYLSFSKTMAVNPNLQNIYKINKLPSDTQMRAILNEVELDPFRKIFKKLFAKLQRSKILEKYIYLKDHYLVTADFSWVTDIIIT